MITIKVKLQGSKSVDVSFPTEDKKVILYYIREILGFGLHAGNGVFYPPSAILKIEWADYKCEPGIITVK